GLCYSPGWRNIVGFFWGLVVSGGLGVRVGEGRENSLRGRGEDLEHPPVEFLARQVAVRDFRQTTASSGQHDASAAVFNQTLGAKAPARVVKSSRAIRVVGEKGDGHLLRLFDTDRLLPRDGVENPLLGSANPLHLSSAILIRIDTSRHGSRRP